MKPDSKAAVPQVLIAHVVLPAALLDAAYDVFSQASLGEGVFLPRSALREERHDLPLEKGVAGFVLRFLRVVESNLPASLPVEECQGYEVWSKVLLKGAASFLHVDNDEHLRQRTGDVRTPEAGAILHLGPASGVVGGATVFDLADGACEASPFATGSWKDVSGQLRQPFAVPFVQGRLIVFSGRVPHVVQPVNTERSTPRVSLVANLWRRAPEPPHGAELARES